MILRPYETHIAFRFLLKGRGQTALLLGGIAVGVAVQFFLSSLIGGLQLSLIERTIGSAPHIYVLPPDDLPTSILAGEGATVDSRRVPYAEMTEILSWRRYYDFLKGAAGVTAACPVAGGQGFIERGGATETIAVKGLMPEEGAVIYRFDRNLKAGRGDVGGESAILGLSIAERLRLDLGDRFFVRNSKGGGDTFTLTGIIDLGSVQADAIVFLSLDRARSFLGLDGVSAIEVKVGDPFAAEALAAGFRGEFSRVKFESWQERNRELLTALRSQSGSSGVIQFFVLFAISLGIASVLGIAAVQKSRQLGILKAMGVDDRGAARIFLIQGLTLGLVGSALGIGLGYAIGAAFLRFFGTGEFGLELEALNLVVPAVLAVTGSALASLVPARKAARLSPIEVIRNG
ncbi:MAG TPA: ABC transporter permease [Candidatus Aminicenantes bacterium]|nr:ABC transporter permease [Candidatus Aminicenantes bacterium]HDT14428.1 ABC transporter permease [Candidatus Aminicenantes bacterium]